MKKKVPVIISILLVCVFGLAACAKAAPPAYDGGVYAPGDSAGEPMPEESGPNISQRKIIFVAEADVYTDDFDATVAAIRGALDKSEGEWFDNENISENYAYFKARVKSGRLDEFLGSVAESGKLKNLNKTATDISLEYHDIQHRLESLQAEYDRLTELKKSAAMYELLQIEQRQSEINYKIISLQSNLNKYESLLEYSEITLKVYAKSAPAEKTPYKERLSNVFKGAWEALKTFLGWVLIVITAVFPFAIVIVPAGAGVAVLVVLFKRRKAKKSAAVLTASKTVKAAEEEKKE